MHWVENSGPSRFQPKDYDNLCRPHRSVPVVEDQVQVRIASQVDG